jgi:putative phosphotransacetylase
MYAKFEIWVILSNVGLSVNVEISARHVHLSKTDFIALFGKDAVINKVHDLSLVGEFLTDKRVSLVGAKSTISNVAVLAPFRDSTQVEISRTDCFALGEKSVPLRLSGDLAGSAPIKLVSDFGEIGLQSGLIVAKRHLHISKEDAAKAKLKHGDKVLIKIEGERGGILDEITVRISNILTPTVHLDTDEGNAVGGVKFACLWTN